MNIIFKKKRQTIRSKSLMQRVSGLLQRPLRIELQGRVHVFADPNAFTFSLAPRTAVPALRISELYLRDESALGAEVTRVGKLERQLTDIVRDHEMHGHSLLRTLRQTGVMMISKDHDWRAIFDQLITVDHRDTAYARIAISNYLSYLSQRRDVIGSIRLLKENASQESKAAHVGAMPESVTQIFREPVPIEAKSPTPFQRLPQGKAVTLKLLPGTDLTIQLARHCFSLAHGRDWALIADNGQRYALSDGLNSVGRSRENSVAVDSAFRNVSRRHLLVQPVDDDTIVLTDVSSCGTFVAPTALAS